MASFVLSKLCIIMALVSVSTQRVWHTFSNYDVPFQTVRVNLCQSGSARLQFVSRHTLTLKSIVHGFRSSVFHSRISTHCKTVSATSYSALVYTASGKRKKRSPNFLPTLLWQPTTQQLFVSAHRGPPRGVFFCFRRLIAT